MIILQTRKKYQNETPFGTPLTMKVTIRPCKIEDAKTVQKYASDELVNLTTNAPYPYPENGGITFIKNAINNWEKRKGFLFAILVDDKMVGDVGLNLADFEKQTIRCDYAISSSYWGQGITTAAIKLAVSYAFNDLNMKLVISSCLDRNIASRRVLEKNGFMEKSSFIFNSNKFNNEPAHWFELTKANWKAKKVYNS